MSVPRRPRGPAWLLIVLVVATTACTASGPGGPSIPGAGLERFYTQQLSWGPCAPYATTDHDRAAFADDRYECARLEVPLDYDTPIGRIAQLGVLRDAARNGAARIGSLLTNPGGPGFSGMSALAGWVEGGGFGDGDLAERFDLVGSDPRGVGASTPTIDCTDDAEWDVERADLDVDPSPAGVAQTEAENREFVDRRVRRTGIDVLGNVGTRDAARDLDILRAALGDATLTYLGYSYGTRLGTAYAEAYPANVRALVLDGALDPTEGLADSVVNQSAGFQPRRSRR